MLSSNAGVTATAMTTQNYINSSSLPQHNNNDEKTMSDSRSVDSGGQNLFKFSKKFFNLKKDFQTYCQYF